GLALEEARQEAAEIAKVYSWYPQRTGRVDLVVEHARAAGVGQDPVIRQEIARLLAIHRASQLTDERAEASRAIGRPPGPEGSIGKLALSNVSRQAAKVHAMIAGSAAMLAGDELSSPLGALHPVIAEILISVPSQSIAGGTDEIQRNILGEKF